MIWVLGSSIAGCVAGVAIAWGSGESCCVALGADGSSMNTDQRKARYGMVKVRILPVVCIMAHQTVKRMLLRFVILGSIILYLMASNTFGWRIQ